MVIYANLMDFSRNDMNFGKNLYLSEVSESQGGLTLIKVLNKIITALC